MQQWTIYIVQFVIRFVNQFIYIIRLINIIWWSNVNFCPPDIIYLCGMQSGSHPVIIVIIIILIIASLWFSLSLRMHCASHSNEIESSRRKTINKFNGRQIVRILYVTIPYKFQCVRAIHNLVYIYRDMRCVLIGEADFCQHGVSPEYGLLFWNENIRSSWSRNNEHWRFFHERVYIFIYIKYMCI